MRRIYALHPRRQPPHPPRPAPPPRRNPPAAITTRAPTLRFPAHRQRQKTNIFPQSRHLRDRSDAPPATYPIVLNHLASCERRPQKHCCNLLHNVAHCCKACCKACGIPCCNACGKARCKPCGKMCCIARFVSCCMRRRAEHRIDADFAITEYGWTPPVRDHDRASPQCAHAEYDGCAPL